MSAEGNSDTEQDRLETTGEVQNPAGTEDHSVTPSSSLVTAYPWVTQEVLGNYSNMTKSAIQNLKIKPEKDYELRVPGKREPICIKKEKQDSPFFFFYADLITRMGVRLPFSDFQIDVLNHLRVAPSQLAPNAWGFIVAFENFCKKIKISATVPLLFYFFTVQHTRTGKEPKEKKSWVTLRGHPSRRLFSVYTNSFKSFKNKFFKVAAKPGKCPWFLTRDKEGEREGKFPLAWDEDHYKLGTKTFCFDEAQLPESDAISLTLIGEYQSDHGQISVSSFVSASASAADTAVRVTNPAVARPASKGIVIREHSEAGPGKPKFLQLSSKDKAVVVAPTKIKKKRVFESTLPGSDRPFVPGNGSKKVWLSGSAEVEVASLPPPADKSPRLSSPAENEPVSSSPRVDSHPEVWDFTQGTPVDDAPCPPEMIPASGAQVVPLTSIPAPPSPDTVPTSPRPALYRNMVWGDPSKGPLISNDLGDALLPPPRFFEPAALSSEDAKMLEDAELVSLRLAGLPQAFALLHHKYRVACSKLEIAQKKIKENEGETNKVNAELTSIKNDLHKTKGEKEIITAELLQVKESLRKTEEGRDQINVELLGAKKTAEQASAQAKASDEKIQQLELQLKNHEQTIQEQLLGLKRSETRRVEAEAELKQAQAQANAAMDEVEWIKEGLFALSPDDARLQLGEATYKINELTEVLRTSVKESFDNAVAQLQILNPCINFEITGLHHRAWVQDGILNPPSPSEGDNPEEEDQEEDQGVEGVSPDNTTLPETPGRDDGRGDDDSPGRD